MSSLINNVLSAIGSGVGGVASGPVSGIGAVANLISGVMDRVSTDPTQAAQMKLQLAQLDQQGVFKELDTKIALSQADSQQVVAYDATIAADAVGKSWLQRNAQAIAKLSTVGLVFSIYVFLPAFHQVVPVVPESAWLMLASILGISAYHQGKADVEKVKNQGL